MNALYKNGITTEDLTKAYEDGYKEAWADSTPGAVKTCYAAIVLALKRERGFNRDQCETFLRAVDDIVRDSLTSAELIDRVFEEVGLQLDFSDPFERVKEIDE